MLESPLIRDIVAEAKAEAKAEAMHKCILSFLKARIGPVPPDLVTEIQDIRVESKLQKLVDFAALCPDLEAFRARVQSVGRRRGWDKR